MSRSSACQILLFLVGFSLIAFSYSAIQGYVNGLVLTMCFMLLLFKAVPLVNSQQLFVLGFLISVFLSLVFSISLFQSLIPSFYIYFVIGTAIILAWSIHSNTELKVFLFAISVGFLAVALRNFFSESGAIRAGGVADQSNALGLMSGTGVFVSFVWLKYFRRPRDVFSGLLVFSSLAGSFYWLIMSGSRGAFLSAFSSLIFFVFMDKTARFRNVFLFSVLAVAVLFVFDEEVKATSMFQRLAVLPSAIGLDWGSAADVDKQYSSAQDDTRLYLAETAISGFLNRPILGNGASTFNHYSDYVYTHSSHFEILFSFGIFGVVFFYGFVVVSCWRVLSHWRSNNTAAVILLGCLVFFLLSGISIPSFQSKMHIPLYVLIFVTFKAFRIEGLVHEQSGRRRSTRINTETNYPLRS